MASNSSRNPTVTVHRLEVDRPSFVGSSYPGRRTSGPVAIGSAAGPDVGSHPDLVGPILRESTIEVIRADLQRQSIYSPGFVERYFPDVALRGRAEASDVVRMSRAQADAVSYSLARSIRTFYRGAEHAGEAPGEAAPQGDGMTESAVGRFHVKSLRYAAALRDVCAAYGLESVV